MWIKNNNKFPARGLSTPPATWKSRPFLHSPLSERKHRSPSSVKPDPYHVLHKVPAGDSPYVKAKHVQLIDKDPSKAISLFWGAINSGDRVDSALKDMAVVMKQLNRSEEAIEAIKSFRHLCPHESQDSLDNLLVELYKKAGRVEEEIEMLQLKLKRIEDSSLAFGGRKMKTARSQGKKIHITVDQERSRILGNLAWAYMQQNNYKSAEEVYRKALTLEPDYNKQCNLAICLMHTNKIGEAKSLLQGVIRPSSCKDGNQDDDSYARSFERAFQMLTEIDSSSVPTTSLHDDQQGKDNNKNQRSFTSPINGISKELASSTSEGRGYGRSPEGNGIPEAAYISQFPVRAIPKVLLSEPRRGSWFFNKGDDQRRRGGLWRDDAVGVYSSHTCMESQTADNVGSKTFAHGYEKNSSDVTVSGGSKGVKDVTENSIPSHCRKMSWADMVEEDERKLAIERNDHVETKWSVDRWEAREGYYDENLNSNITFPVEQMLDNLSIKNESNELKDGYCIKSGNDLSIKNESNELKDGYCIKSGNGMISSTVRRSLCFDLQPNAADPVEFLCSSSPLPKKALNFEGGDSFAPADGKNIKPPMRRNRLQVFKNITLLPESP